MQLMIILSGKLSSADSVECNYMLFKLKNVIHNPVNVADSTDSTELRVLVESA